MRFHVAKVRGSVDLPESRGANCAFAAGERHAARSTRRRAYVTKTWSARSLRDHAEGKDRYRDESRQTGRMGSAAGRERGKETLRKSWSTSFLVRGIRSLPTCRLCDATRRDATRRNASRRSTAPRRAEIDGRTRDAESPSRWTAAAEGSRSRRESISWWKMEVESAAVSFSAAANGRRWPARDAPDEARRPVREEPPRGSRGPPGHMAPGTAAQRRVDAITGGRTRGDGRDGRRRRGVDRTRSRGGRALARAEITTARTLYSPMTIFCWTALGCSGCFSVSPMMVRWCRDKQTRMVPSVSLWC